MTDQLPIGPPAAEWVDQAQPATPALDKLIAEYAVKRARREQVDEERRAASQEEAVAEAKLFDAIEALGLKSVKSEEHGTFILSDLAWASVTDVARMREWLLQEAPEILQANATKLAMYVREAVRGEREMPPGVEPRFTRKINWRR